MGDVLARMNQNRAFENHYTELQSISDKIVQHSKNLEGLLTTVRSLASSPRIASLICLLLIFP